MRRPLLLIAFTLTLAIAAVAVGCTGNNSKLLEAHQWRVTKVGAQVYNGPAEMTAVFSAGKLSGSTGINSYSGNYTAGSGSSISVTVGPMTLVGGSAAASKLETDFIKGLGSAASYAADDESLTLFDARGTATLTFAAK
jgi:heat shock protein HslJ